MRGKDRDLVGGDGGGGSLDLVEPFLMMWVVAYRNGRTQRRM